MKRRGAGVLRDTRARVHIYDMQYNAVWITNLLL